MHDDRERLEQYLAWRGAERKTRRGRIYRRAGIAGALVVLVLLGVTLGVVGHRGSRGAKRDGVRLAAPPPRVTPTRPSPLPEVPSLSTRETTRTDAAVEATPPVRAPETTQLPARSTTHPARVRTAPATASRQQASVPSAPAAAAVSASSSASDSAPAASPRPDTSSASASTTPSPHGAESDSSHSSTTTVIVEPPRAPMPTVIVAPPDTATPAMATSPTTTAPGTLPETAVSSASQTVEQPAAAPSEPEGRMQKLKGAIGYIPEVWVARKIAGWVKRQPTGELDSAPSERALPQAR